MLPGDHAVAGVGQDVDQEESPEHRRLKHRVLSDEALDVLLITPGFALQRGLDITQWLYSLPISPENIDILETLIGADNK